MMPKTTLIAPAGVGGQIHASHSGRNYDISDDGTVVVDAVDVAALLSAGFQHVPPGPDHRKVADDAAPVETDTFGSQDQGAGALDPDDRLKNTRETPEDTKQENHDHGDAISPHGEPIKHASTDASRAEAQAEADAAARSGVREQPSAVPDTGHMGTAVPTAGDQAAARAEPAPAI